MHTLRASQERSLPCALLLQKQPHRPGLKIFMIRMTERNSDLQQLLPQPNPELCTGKKLFFRKLERSVANKGLVKDSQKKEEHFVQGTCSNTHGAAPINS